VNTTGVTLVVVKPYRHAIAGSNAYILHVRGRRILGWIEVGEDNRTMYTSLDHDRLRPVGTVACPAELTPDWITSHATEILQPF
jgi:hypothetical protein